MIYEKPFKFNEAIRIDFEDGSVAIFNYAQVDVHRPHPQSKYTVVTVYTEHCGNHVFTLVDGVDKLTQVPFRFPDDGVVA